MTESLNRGQRLGEPRQPQENDRDSPGELERWLQEDVAAQEVKSRIRKWKKQNPGRSWNKARVEFRMLAAEYHVPLTIFAPDDPVFEILRSLHAGCELPASDLNLLVERGAPRFVDKLHEIRVHERKYQETGEVEILARISSLWRALGEPHRALEVGGRIIGPGYAPRRPLPPNVEAMVLTSYGGALRDLSDLAGARKCAEKAITLRPNHGYAYCLLGAIDIQEGDHEKGDLNLAKCESLNPSGRKDEWRQWAIKNARFQSDYAAYLLERDPVLHEWARRFLN